MGMRETLEKLHALQEANSRISQLRRDRDALLIDVDNQTRLMDLKKRRAEEVHEKRLERTREADQVQLQIEEGEEEIARLRGKLNIVENQREYDAVQHMIASHKADIQKWEDEALGALQAIDDLAEQEERLATEIRQATAELETVKSRCGEEAAQYDRRIEQVEQERDRIREQATPEVLSVYDRLALRHPQNALAVVTTRVCSGCYTQITKQTEVLLMRDETLVHCHSCGRILMLQE